MKLLFERWSEEQNFSIKANNLFQESFICYKNNAYRASLLFSYLGFLTHIKEVIIKTPPPASLKPGRWTNLLANLQNDDTWEKAVYEEITNSSNPIFNIKEDLRLQVKYWKDRRNDAAHFKSNEIAAHHSDSFWSFVKSNLLKITIEGSRINLLNKFEQHFDPTYTPPNADFTHLVKEIDEAVEIAEFTDFWNDLTSKIDPHGFFSSYESNTINVLNKVLELCNENTVEKLVDFLKVKKIDLEILYFHPDKISLFNYTPAEIRKIWRNRMWRYTPNTYSIYTTLLRNTLIPNGEIKESNNFVAETTKDWWYPLDIHTHETLKSNGFGDAVFKMYIEDDKLSNWFFKIQPRAGLIAYYISNYPLKDLTVEVVCEMYGRPRYSHWLGDLIEREFVDNPSLKQEFHDIANKNSFQIPQKLQ